MDYNSENNNEIMEIMIGNDEGMEVPFYIIDRAVVKEKEYFLAVDHEDPDLAEEMLILVNVSSNDNDLVLEIVDDEAVLDEVSAVFEEQLDDTELMI